MDFRIFNIALLLFFLQLTGLLARRHHQDDSHHGDHHGYDDDDYDDDWDANKGDSNELSDYCMYFRIDHDLRQTDTMFCPFGCCGNLDDQKCCEDPEKDNDKRGHARFVHGLLIFAGVMLVIALTCCGFGIYKHKKAKLRKTSPGRHYQTTVPAARPAPYAIFYTPRSGNGWAPSGKSSKDLPSYSNQSNDSRPAAVKTPPPRHTGNAEPDQDLPPYSARSPPPPYSFTSVSLPPSATEFRSSN